MTKAKDLRQKNLVELNEEMTALLKQLFALRMKKAIQSLENPNQLKQIRRDIARVKTIMTEMQKGAC
jgi:large subunit ribosomal protein L29